jgi:lipid A 3-O-deacylase
MEIQVGVIGPASLAEQAQNFVHDLRGIQTAQGWDNQLENEPGIVLIYERKIRAWEAPDMNGWGYDSILHLGGAVGNVHTYANVGFQVRAGWNIPTDFGSNLIRPGGEASSPLDSSDPRFTLPHGFSAHAFAGASGRVVLRDIFLDGNTYQDSHSLSKQNLGGDLFVGVALVWGPFKLAYTQVYRADEFSIQRGGHEFGSASISYLY